jgi:hypothetical protein
MPKTSSADRLAAVTEDLVAILQQPHPSTPFLDLGTATNDAIAKLRSIYSTPTTNGISSPRVPNKAVSVLRVLNTNTNRLRTILEENEISPNGTEIIKKFKEQLYRGAVTSHDEETNLYRIDYADGYWEEMNQKQVNKYKCLDTAKDRMKRFT